MGRRANPTLIGGFLVGAVVLAVLGLLVFGRGQFFTERRTYVLYFDGSVKGLNVGAPVDFQGVKVGTVTDIRVQHIPDTDEFRAPVYVQLEMSRVGQAGGSESPEDARRFLESLFQRGLRAQLVSQSFVTGQLFVQLGFYPDSPMRLVGAEPNVTELPTIPTTLQQAQAAAEDILEKIQQLPLDQLFSDFLQTVEGANRLVNSPELPALIASLHAVTLDTQQVLRRVDAGIAPLVDGAQTVTSGAQALLMDLQQLVRHVDSQIGPLADGTKQTLEATRGILKDGQQLMRNVDGRVGRLSDDLADTAQTAQTTIVTAQRRLDDQLVMTLQEAISALRSIRLLADYLERNPNALLYGKGGDRR